MASGDQLLIVDGNDRHLEGMRKLFDDAGYVCSTAKTIPDAQQRVQERLFPAALVDLDVDRAGAGIDLAQYIREHSPPTSVIMLSTRRSFEGAVGALRKGALDVVLKESNQVQHLRQSVDAACDKSRGREGDTDMLREVHKVLDESFRVMLALARRVYHDVSVGSAQSFKPRVLVVDSDQQFMQELAQHLGNRNWEIAAEMAGGAALDKAGEQGFDVVVTRDELMDLKGTMVVKTVQSNRAEAIGLVYSSEGEGRIERYMQELVENVERPFGGAEHLVSALDNVVEQLSATQSDRAVIQAFRNDHEDFLRRYAELKTRIGRMLG